VITKFLPDCDNVIFDPPTNPTLSFPVLVVIELLTLFTSLLNCIVLTAGVATALLSNMILSPSLVIVSLAGSALLILLNCKLKPDLPQKMLDHRPVQYLGLHPYYFHRL